MSYQYNNHVTATTTSTTSEFMTSTIATAPVGAGGGGAGTSQYLWTSKRQVEAAHVIQRAYRKYRLEKMILDLKENEPWFFDWSRYSDNEQLRVDRLLTKLTSPEFLYKISQLMVLLGLKRECADCHAKSILLAFMLLHNGKNTDQVLMKRIQNVGTTFLRVCQDCRCYIRRVRFLDAFDTFYTCFLSKKSQEAAYLLPGLLSQMADTMSAYNGISKCINQGRVSYEKCRGALNRLHARARAIMSTICCYTGSEEIARKALRKEVARRRFLTTLKEKSNVRLNPDWSDKNRYYRCVAMNLTLNDQFESVRTNSREERYDCSKDTNSVMRTQYHMKLAYIKQLVRTNYGLKQELWVPSFINHVRLVLNMLDRVFDVDDECVAQQCSLNCYSIDKLLQQMLNVMREGGNNEDPVMLKLQEELELHGTSQSLIFQLLDRLDDLRIDFMDRFFMLNKGKLKSITKHYELRFFIEDLSFHKGSVEMLLRWAYESKKDSKLLTPVDDLDIDISSEQGRLNRMMSTFATQLVAFPSPQHLNAMSETFKYMRLPMLRTMILVRDVVLGFSILHFAMGLSQDRSKALRLKKAILDILGDDVRHAQSEIVTRICSAVEIERPCMTEGERRVLWGLVTRLVRKPVGMIDEDSLEEVPRLALLRIRMAVQKRLLDCDSYEVPKLNYFEQEVACIAQCAHRMWETSMRIYKPVYDTILHCGMVWDTPATTTNINNDDTNELHNDLYLHSMEID